MIRLSQDGCDPALINKRSLSNGRCDTLRTNERYLNVSFWGCWGVGRGAPHPSNRFSKPCARVGQPLQHWADELRTQPTATGGEAAEQSAARAEEGQRDKSTCGRNNSSNNNNSNKNKNANNINNTIKIRRPTTIRTWNIRTLHAACGKILVYELKHERKRYRWDILGLAEERDRQQCCTHISSRMIAIRLEAKPLNVSIIHVCAPTSAYEENEVEEFYKELDNLIKEISKKDILIVQGNWNAKVRTDAY
ncbi:hypothetical protein CAPTEDRAFT_211259 [Capitella teleta]|uniref:Endonuclease/exonuclease/phosphatase domain-containing protein n=1 Tax=Capitella teleta TaxID=283909 RepID=R7TRB1_CAPTE|nr:hypothetical protein CAPTEDRAFT_211259 [Capitella teleta]|eukprot:ELT93570.1 hypothetical protein CAPTEDRAFT_211259 [Capitella teleta]